MLLRFNKDFHTCHWDGNLYNVLFTYNRVNIRRLYQAVEAADNLEPDLLFPYQSTKRRLISTERFVPFSSRANASCANDSGLQRCSSVCNSAPPI